MITICEKNSKRNWHFARHHFLWFVHDENLWCGANALSLRLKISENSLWLFSEQFSSQMNSQRHWQVYCSSCFLLLNFQSPFYLFCSTLCLFAYLHAYQYSLFNLNMSSIELYTCRGQIECHSRPDVCLKTMNNKYVCALYVMYELFPVQVSVSWLQAKFFRILKRILNWKTRKL